MVEEIKNWIVERMDPVTEKQALGYAQEYAKTIREYSLALYKTANKHAQEK
jgi:hypothetical protein